MYDQGTSGYKVYFSWFISRVILVCKFLTTLNSYVKSTYMFTSWTLEKTFDGKLKLMIYECIERTQSAQSLFLAKSWVLYDD